MARIVGDEVLKAQGTKLRALEKERNSLLGDHCIFPPAWALLDALKVYEDAHGKHVAFYGDPALVEEFRGWLNACDPDRRKGRRDEKGRVIEGRPANRLPKPKKED